MNETEEALRSCIVEGHGPLQEKRMSKLACGFMGTAPGRRGTYSGCISGIEG